MRPWQDQYVLAAMSWARYAAADARFGLVFDLSGLAVLPVGTAAAAAVAQAVASVAGLNQALCSVCQNAGKRSSFVRDAINLGHSSLDDVLCVTPSTVTAPAAQ